MSVNEEAFDVDDEEEEDFDLRALKMDDDN